MMTETAAHVADGPLQERGELLLFFFRKTINDPVFVFVDDPVDLPDVFPSLFQYVDPFASAVGRIRAKFHETFLLQPA